MKKRTPTHTYNKCVHEPHPSHLGSQARVSTSAAVRHSYWHKNISPLTADQRSCDAKCSGLTDHVVLSGAVSIWLLNAEGAAPGAEGLHGQASQR